MCPISAPSAVVGGGVVGSSAEPLGSCEASRQQADGRALDIAFDAGDLSGKAQARHRLQAQRSVEQLGAVDERVAVQAAETRELGFGEAGDHAEDAHLLGVLQLGLEADHVPQRAERIVLAQLHDRIGRSAPGARIVEPYRFHRPKAQRVATALGHHLDRQAAVEVGRRGFPFLERRLVAGEQRIDEGVVLFARHRAVEIVGAGAGRPRLVVARLEPGDGRVDRLAMDDRRDGIEEGEVALRR